MGAPSAPYQGNKGQLVSFEVCANDADWTAENRERRTTTPPATKFSGTMRPTEGITTSTFAIDCM